MHAGPDDVWRAPSTDAPDEELIRTHGPLRSPRVVYGHIHHAYIRRLPSLTLANAGSVSLSYDGDPRAAYVLVDDDRMTIRRVTYDIEREVATLVEAGYPDAAWLAEMLRTGTFVWPPE